MGSSPSGSASSSADLLRRGWSLRAALRDYEAAVEADPGNAKAHYQPVGDAIARYEGEAIAGWEAIAAFSPEDADCLEQESKRLRG